MSVLLTTTGTTGTITLSDLGGRTFTHPTTDFVLTDEYRLEELRDSDDLASYLAAGHITLKDENSVAITTLIMLDDIQNASKVKVTSTGNLSSTNVQSALEELQGDIDNIIPINGTDVELSNISGATYTNVQRMQDIFHSSGLASGGVIVDEGGGSISVTSGTGYIRPTNDRLDTLLAFNFPALTSTLLTDGVINYVKVDYNSGSPIIQITLSADYNNQTEFILGSIVREGSLSHIAQNSHQVGDHAGLMIRRMHEATGVQRDKISGGLTLGQSGDANRYVTLSSGALWARLNRFTIAAINTATADIFDSYYRDGVGGFTKVSSVSSFDNAFYDNGSGTLAALGTNKYTNLWWYLPLDGDLCCVYGRAEYSSLATAQAASPPNTLPPRLNNENIVLVGRFTVQQGSNIATIQSAFTTTFSGAAIPAHNDLSGLNSGDYLHLTAAEYSKVLLQDGAKLSATASGTDTYTATISPAITSYLSTHRFFIKFTNGNTGASTINLNALGAISIVKNGSTSLASGDISAGQIYCLAYDGTNFQILGKIVSESLQNVTTNGNTTTNDIIVTTGSGSGIYTDLLQVTGGTGTQGELTWDTNEETLALVLNGNTTHLNHDSLYHVRNTTGSTIPINTPVYASGVIGGSGRITIAPMIANSSIDSKYLLGVTAEEITNNTNGKVAHFGRLNNVNTSSWIDGDILYVSPTVAGGWTTTPPSSPNQTLPIAIVVYSHATNGILHIRISNVNPHNEISGLNTGDYLHLTAAEYSKVLLQDGAKLSATASGTDTYTATISPAITSYLSTHRFFIKFTNGNTGASTINLNSLGAISIVKNGSTALSSGDISAGQIYCLAYDGTNFQIVGKISSATGLDNIVEDTTPQLGGNLDVNGNKIVSVSNGNIDIEPNGTGNVLLGNLTFDADQTIGAGQDNYVLTYDNATGLVSLEPSISGTSLDGLSDVNLTAPAQGDILYRNATEWVNLPAGTSGQVLQTNGTGANPTWVTPTGGSSFTKVSKSYTNFTAAATSESITLFTLTAGYALGRIVLKHSTAFAGTAWTAATVEIGIAGDTTKYLEAVNVFQTAGSTVIFGSHNWNMENWDSNTTIQITLRTTGGNISAGTAGALDVYYEMIQIKGL